MNSVSGAVKGAAQVIVFIKDFFVFIFNFKEMFAGYHFFIDKRLCSVIAVSYTHLDVYKRQEPTLNQSLENIVNRGFYK